MDENKLVLGTVQFGFWTTRGRAVHDNAEASGVLISNPWSQYTLNRAWHALDHRWGANAGMHEFDTDLSILGD